MPVPLRPSLPDPLLRVTRLRQGYASGYRYSLRCPIRDRGQSAPGWRHDPGRHCCRTDSTDRLGHRSDLRPGSPHHRQRPSGKLPTSAMVAQGSQTAQLAPSQYDEKAAVMRDMVQAIRAVRDAQTAQLAPSQYDEEAAAMRAMVRRSWPSVEAVDRSAGASQSRIDDVCGSGAGIRRLRRRQTLSWRHRTTPPMGAQVGSLGSGAERLWTPTGAGQREGAGRGSEGTGIAERCSWPHRTTPPWAL